MKAPEPALSEECVAWVRLANARWIVRHDLGRNAAAYLDHLERTDPGRLLRSCRNVCLLIRERAPAEDPKPWFYAGLFSRATPTEAREFLSRHWLVATATAPAAAPPPADVSSATLDMIRRLREAIARLPGP